MNAPDRDPRGWLRERAPWLFEERFGACIVGSWALAIACRRAGIPEPKPGDLDLSWSPATDEGRMLLERHGVFLATTEGNVDRGTLAMQIDGQRLEITTHRGQSVGSTGERIASDLAARDMTIGALAVELATGRVHDPHGGLDDWREGRIAPVGDPEERVREHPVRWLRYFRKGHELGFVIDKSIRSLKLPASILDEVPREAIALELRAILTRCTSPGRCLLELHEVDLLAHLAPEIAPQFDGRAAGPQRWHPEVSQALHLILALEWAAKHTGHLDDRDRTAVLLAVLCHDLGKGFTKAKRLPSHPGHEQEGIQHVESFLRRWPGLADQKARTLSVQVCGLHLLARKFGELRSGTLARLYDETFRPKDYPIELFALAVAADSAGRLGLEDTGDAVRDEVVAQLEWLRHACGSVDARALRNQHPNDLGAFRRALHEARARAIKAAEGEAPPGTSDRQ